MNKVIIILGLALLTSVSYSQKKKDTVDQVQKAYMKNNKKAIDKASPMINFFLKYQDSSKTPTQGDFGKLISIYGAKETKNGMTQEQGFKIVDGYIKASEGKKEKPEKETIDETESGYDTKTEEEKAEKELPGQIKSVINEISYNDFKEMMQTIKPNATEAEIKKEYNKLQKATTKL